MNKTTLYLVCGLPGAGKSTRSRRIAASVGAVHLSADDWVMGLGVSLLDFGFRIELQPCLLRQAAALLRRGVSVVLEFGSWHEEERETIRKAAVDAGARTELHFVDAPLDELARRVRARGGREDEALAATVLPEAGRFERPTPDEIARFDRYVGPDEPYDAAAAPQ